MGYPLFLYDLDNIFRQILTEAEEPPGGALPRWLLDPGGFFRDLLSSSTTYLDSFWSTSRAWILIAFVLAVAIGLLLRRLRARAWQRARASARWVEVVSPAVSGLGDGPAMWRQLTGLLRPGALGGRIRLLTWELRAGHEQVHAGLWVPGSINPAHVARTVSGAYPRSRVSAGPPGTDLGPLLPPPRPAPPGLLPGGYGNLNYGSTSVTLQSWLRDTSVGDGRVYAHTTIARDSNGSVFVYLNSGKRSDGESSYARMADQGVSLDNGSGAFHYTVQTCRSVTLNDPCSRDKRTNG